MQKLTRWGNSTGLRIPAAVLDAAGLKPGSYVSVRLMDSGDLRIRPAHRQAVTDEEERETPQLIETKW